MPATAPAVRSITEADAAGVAELLGELGYPSPVTSVPGRLAALARDSRAVAYAAEREGVLAGIVTAHRLASIHDDGPVAWITTLVVSSRARGQGVGRRLVQAVEDWAQTHGCVRIAVTTALHRSGAHAFYERLGYHHSGRRYTKILGRPS